MSQHSTLRSLCVSRITPIVAALTFAVGAQDASAGTLERQAISDKLVQIPGFKTTGDAGANIVKAKAADLLYAIALLLEDNRPVSVDGDQDYSVTFTNADVEDIVAEALSAQLVSGKLKARADKDKIAADIVTTAIGSRGLASDTANKDLIAGIVRAAFISNSASSNTALALKSTGKAAVLAAGLKAAPQVNSEVGLAIGRSIALLSDTEQGDIKTLLQNTSKALGKSAGAATTAFSGAVASLVDDGEVTLDTINAASLTVAATVPAAVGAMYGGLTHSSTGFNGAPFNDPGLKGLGISILNTPKLAKANGEIFANIFTDYGSDFETLTEDLLAVGKTTTPQTKGLLAQGLLRAGGSATDVLTDSNILSGLTASTLAAFAGIVSTGNGANGSIDEITNALISAPAAALPADKININTAIINGLGTATPDAAKDATAATIAANVDAMTLATTSVAKIKVTAAAGAMAAAAVEKTLNPAAPLTDDQKVQTAATNSSLIMNKGAKSATDIARNVASLSDVKDLTGVTGFPEPTLKFADLLADASKKFVLNVAVGVSLADSENTPAITLAAITHDLTLDKAALGQTAKIAGAVATAVDVEQSSLLANTLSGAMSVKGLDSGKPINISSLNAMATSIAKAIQSKANVKTFNRSDELGELGAFLVANIIGKFGTDTKGLTAEFNAIKSLGTALFKVLNSKDLNQWRTQKADRRFWFDIVGSIALTIKNSNTSQKADLLAANGPLATAFAKLAGTAGASKITNTFLAVNSADPLTVTAVNDAFENGFVTSELIVNDAETDNRDSFTLGKTL